MTHAVATRKTGNFAYDHPALVATIASILIGGAFLGALAQNSGHGPATHGSAKPAASGSAAPASATATPTAKH